MAERKPLRFAQALVETGKEDVDCEIYKIPYKEFTYKDLETYLKYNNALPLGLGAGYWKDSTKLAVLAIVSAEKGIVIEFPEPSRRPQADATPTVNTESEKYQALQILLARPAGEFFSFDMAPLSMTLYLEQNLRMTNAIDIQSAFPNTDRYSISKILKAALGDKTKIWETNLASAFDNIEYNPDIRTSVLEPVKRAWLAYHLASVDDAITTYSDTPRINTLEMDAALLEVISKITVDSQRLDHKRPDHVVRDFTYAGYDAKNDEHKVASNAFKNRFRGSEKVRVTVEDESGSFAARGQVDASGRLALFSDGGLGIGSRVITTIIGLGREPPTAAAKARDRSLLRLLQKEESPGNAWLQNIWFNKEASSISWPEEWFSNASKYPALSPSVTAGLAQAAGRLNASQQVAVNAMLSKDPKHVLAIVQGPPGTGKTSVIAFFVQMAIALGKTGLWLVAQSNVAVKNIAEKLSSVGFNDYRLLVSREFIKDWHDHLYFDVNRNVIRSDEFTTVGSNQTRGIKVYLCTLSMLAHPLLRIFTNKCPLNTLVVDEASQIHVADYVSIFYKYSGLRKACFIGDDKQLPPFGQEDAPDGLPSIFEVPHLRGHAFFLDTQYRMPPQSGDLISEAVYDGLLKSFSGHPIKNQTMACHFVDVPSTEKRKDDSYWNEGERDIVLQIAQYLQDNKMPYKIISPYDAQRNAIESKMKALPDLEWGNTCFNVDSFQGNEEDYIIVSLVRSKEIGFLKSLRRTNVMLTRFRRGMFVVSSKKFLDGPGRDCLVGEIAQQVGSGAWLSVEDVARSKFFGPKKTSK